MMKIRGREHTHNLFSGVRSDAKAFWELVGVEKGLEVKEGPGEAC